MVTKIAIILLILKEFHFFKRPKTWVMIGDRFSGKQQTFFSNTLHWKSALQCKLYIVRNKTLISQQRQQYTYSKEENKEKAECRVNKRPTLFFVQPAIYLVRYEQIYTF